MDKKDEIDLDTLQRTDRLIERVMYAHTPLRAGERRELELLLRRYRKRYFGSAIMDWEREAGRAEINP